jgi:hypothetical protein
VSSCFLLLHNLRPSLGWVHSVHGPMLPFNVCNSRRTVERAHSMSEVRALLPIAIRWTSMPDCKYVGPGNDRRQPVACI